MLRSPLLPLFLALSGAPAPAPPVAPAIAEEHDVDLALITDAPSMRPGEPFELGAHLTIPAGWHVYWENAGDTGMPTFASLTAPEGFRVEGPFYPAPHRFEEMGLVSYGYEDEAVLFFRVTPPDEVPAKARFEVAADWLVCKEACFIGEGTASLTLDRSAEARDEREVERMAAFRARLPRPLEGLGAGATAKAAGALSGDEPGGTATVEVTVPGPPDAALELYPRTHDGLEIARVERERRGDATLLRIQYTVIATLEADDPARTGGVLELPGDDGPRFFSFDVPLRR